MAIYYTPTGVPSTSAQLLSTTIRSEFTLISTSLDAMLPVVSGNGSKIVAINSGGTALEAITTTGSGSGVRATSPTLTTPTLTSPTLTTPTLTAPTFTGTATAAALTMTGALILANATAINFKNFGGTTRTTLQLFSDNKLYLDSFDGDMVLRTGTTPTMGLTVTTDQRVYGSALHNNAGAVTGTVNQYIASGTYTPTTTGVGNIGAVSPNGAFQWVRVGNVVFVSGEASVDPTTTATTTSFRISLPIASAIGNSYELAGAGSFSADAGANRASAIVNGLAATDDASCSFFAPTANAGTLACTFQYVVL